MQKPLFKCVKITTHRLKVSILQGISAEALVIKRRVEKKITLQLLTGHDSTLESTVNRNAEMCLQKFSNTADVSEIG